MVLIGRQWVGALVAPSRRPRGPRYSSRKPRGRCEPSSTRGRITGLGSCTCGPSGSYSLRLRKEWAHLWEEAQAAPQMGAMSATSEPGQGGEESARQRRIDKRARMFARQGDLSKALSVFDSDAVLDPTEPDIWRQLEQLHDPDTEIEPLPDKPEGLHTDPQYEYGHSGGTDCNCR